MNGFLLATVCKSCNIYFLQMFSLNNIIQKFSGEMKSRKSKKKNEEKEAQLLKKQPSPALKIKFNINSDSIACFIGGKNTGKRITKAGYSPKKQGKSLQKSSCKESQKSATSVTKPAHLIKNSNQCKQIIQSSIKAIFNEGEPSDIRCEWSLADQQSPQSSQQLYPAINTQIWSVESFEKSYASTIDVHPVSYYMNSYQQSQDYYMNYNEDYRFKQFDESSSYTIEIDNIKNDPRTTIMIRNIPNKYTIKQLSQEIDQIFPNTYDFLYLPCDSKNQCNVGYGFINFLDTGYLFEFYDQFHGQKWLKYRSEKICNLTYARLQGLTSLIEHFQNSKVLNQKDKKYRPIIREYSQIGNLIKSQQLL